MQDSRLVLVRHSFRNENSIQLKQHFLITFPNLGQFMELDVDLDFSRLLANGMGANGCTDIKLKI